MKDFFEKLTLLIASTWLCNKLGVLMPLIILLIFMMLIDYISGLFASKKEAIEHPNDKRYGWSSKKGILGIYKKVGYVITVFIAVCIDYLLYKISGELGLKFDSNTYFGILVTIWFIVNEMISVLENAGRMGVELPKFLLNILSELKGTVEKNDEKS